MHFDTNEFVVYLVTTLQETGEVSISYEQLSVLDDLHNELQKKGLTYEVKKQKGFKRLVINLVV